jgi:hypothetical protein
MITDKIKELKEARALTARLEAEVALELKQGLTALPAAYGFDSPKDFCKAVLAAHKKKPGRRKEPGHGAPAPNVTDEVKEKFRKMLGEGMKIKDIAPVLGYATSTLAKLKGAMGLSKKRQPKAA